MDQVREAYLLVIYKINFLNEGGSINMRPDLFKAAIMNVPFVDVLTALLERDLPLTLTDHDEFGNPIEVI
jgi:protease II